jgi:hypothetical protein
VVPWYAQILHPGIKRTGTNMLHSTSNGCFNLAPYITTFNVENSYGIPQFHYELSFTNGLITCSNSSHPVVLHNHVLELGASSAPIKTFNKSFVKGDGKNEVSINWSNSQRMTQERAINTWNQTIEKSAGIGTINNNSPHAPVPTLLFGQTPVNSNSINKFSSWVSSATVWKIQTKLHCSYCDMLSLW